MSTEVRVAPEHSRYEITVDGRLVGFAEYQDIAGARVFTHTEVLPEYEGRGHGGTLVRTALDDVRTAQRTIVALCPFVDHIVHDHPEYGDLVNSELDATLRR
jgi:predicted GNAT family acetyltransferase